MRIIALNPFHSGSHQSFIEGWIRHSQHDFTLLTLPGRHWKWRMRHAPLTFAKEVEQLIANGKHFDLLFSTDMLHLPEFLGFAPDEIQKIPSVIYFHENQLTYPNQSKEQRDLHFAYSNFLTALRADQVWFNSGFHQMEFLHALRIFLNQMPDYSHEECVSEIEKKSLVQSPGMETEFVEIEKPSLSQGIHILWCARWEHDKNPEDFFKALSRLKEQGVNFKLSVIGETYRESPNCFDTAKQELSNEIVYWGFKESREEYEKVLKQADVVVSTANHEFFGISIVEALLSGCFPLVPNRLAYPEVFQNHPDFFYDGTLKGLTCRLVELSGKFQEGNLWSRENLEQRGSLKRFKWSVRSREMDEACIRLVEQH